MKNITVLILAGGDCSRVWPLEEKHFLPFCGRPLISYPISQLIRHGLTNFVIVTNRNNKEMFERLTATFPDTSFVLTEQGQKPGMAQAVISAKKHIAGKKLLVIGPSDIYEDILLDDFKKMLAKNPEGLLAGTAISGYFPGAYLSLDRGKVVKIVEKPDPDKTPSQIINFVFDYFRNSNSLLEAFDKIKTDKDDLYERAIDYLLGKGMELRFLPYKGYWGFLKYPWDVLSLSAYFLGKIEGKNIGKAEIAESAVISDRVYIGDGVKIMENVKITGPSYIGRGTIIGDNSIIRESHIGDNCVVGFTSEIARSHIGNRCWFHHNYIGDSVLADNVSLGAGAVTANFRLDEQPVSSVVNDKKIKTGKTKLGMIAGENVRIGVNAAIMPGVKIGRNSYVGSAVVLDKDLASGKFCSLVNNHYQVAENKNL